MNKASEEKLYDESFVKTALLEIVRQMYNTDYKPDYIVGLKRGGLVPGVMLSHYLDIPFYSLDPDESNCWMSEDAFGYIPLEEQEIVKSRWDISYRKNILIIDDINDTGKTFKDVIEDWQGTCMPKESAWNSVWHNNVKFASLIENEDSDFFVDYVGHTINKLEKPEWCVFPWERWW